MPVSLKKRILQLCISLLICLLLMAAAISLLGLRDQLATVDLAVVPGNTVQTDGTPSKRLQARLDTAIKLFKAGQCKAILVSGATGGEGLDEAIVMKTYLLKQGVPETDIYTDSHGINTFETARYAAQLLKQKGWNSTILVSQFFHMARFQLAMKKFGVPTSGHVHADYFELRDIYSLTREVFAYFEYTFRNPQVD